MLLIVYYSFVFQENLRSTSFLHTVSGFYYHCVRDSHVFHSLTIIFLPYQWLYWKGKYKQNPHGSPRSQTALTYNHIIYILYIFQFQQVLFNLHSRRDLSDCTLVSHVLSECQSLWPKEWPIVHLLLKEKNAVSVCASLRGVKGSIDQPVVLGKKTEQKNRTSHTQDVKQVFLWVIPVTHNAWNHTKQLHTHTHWVWRLNSLYKDT